MCSASARVLALAKAKKASDTHFEELHRTSLALEADCKDQEGPKVRQGLNYYGFRALNIKKALATNGDNDAELSAEVKVGLKEAATFIFELRGCMEPAQDLDTTLDFIK